MKSIDSLRRGMVVVWALILTAVTTTIVGALGAYYVSTARISHFYMKGTSVRFAEQRVLENITADVKKAVDVVAAGGATMVGDFTSVKSVADIVNVLKAQDGKTITTPEGYGLKLSVAGYEDLASKLTTGGGSAEVTITAEVDEKKKPHGGLQAGNRVQQTLRFEAEAEAAATTIPVFDYVYFANNNGRLNSKCIVANGDVGANGKFELKGATLNGFAKAGGRITLHTGDDNPKIWPRPTYMARVAARYPDNFIQTRPTDPIEGEVNGTAYSTPWPGGYDPARTSNPCGDDFEDPPQVVAGPGTKPTWNGAVPTMPQQGDYKAQTKETPKRDPNWTLPEKGKGVYAYGTEPKKGEGDYAYPRAPYKYTGLLYYYYDRNGGFHSEFFSNKSKLDALYEQDKAYLDNAYNAAHEQWVADCAAKDAAWQKKCKELNDDYARACKEVEDYNKKAEEDANKAYLAACDKYRQDSARYAAYQQELAGYNERKAKYDAYVTKKTEYDKQLAKYLEQRAEWNKKYADGNLVDKLTWETVGESATTNTILKESYEQIAWPSQFANPNDCLQYCKDYRMEQTGANGAVVQTCGSLYCANMSNGKQIAFTVVRTNADEYVSNGKGIAKKGEHIQTWPTTKYSVKRTVNAVNTSSGFVPDAFAPISDSDNNNFSSTTLANVRKKEAGSVVLIGTQDKPITINGPVFVNGDVIIRGLVSGRGTIYARRNIHIVGDITYQNPPNWPHDSEDLTTAKFLPEAVREWNSSRDLLSLVAMGNIIVGDYTAGIWTNATQLAYLNLKGQDHINIPVSDTAVGSNDHDYTATDGGTTYGFVYTRTTDGMDYSDWDIPGVSGWYHYNIYKQAHTLTARNRKYYESVFADYTIGGLKQTSYEESSESWKVSVSRAKMLLYTFFGIRDGKYMATSVDLTSAVNQDAGDITEIDAVLFANHGVFGVVGGTYNHNFTLNGALICRDEGLLTSFDDRFSQYDDARVWLNWDMRVKSSTAEGIRMGLIETKQSSKTVLRMYVSDWQQL